MEAIFSYYSTTHRMSAEGEVALSDEAITGLGTTADFLTRTFFGAIIQIVKPLDEPVYLPAGSEWPMMPAHHDEDEREDGDWASEGDERQLAVEDDPHIPVKPARRKTPERQVVLRLTDLVPDVGYFIAGGVSGITSRTATAPLDRLKVYLIAQTGVAQDAVQAAKSGAAVVATKHAGRTLWNACKDLWAAGGIRSLFAGEHRLLIATHLS